jgi:hypothetical protein
MVTDLGEPMRHTVPDAGVEATVRQPRHGAEFHREIHGVAHRSRGDAEADVYPVGDRQCRGHLRDAAGATQILTNPEFVESRALHRPRKRRNVLGGSGIDLEAEFWHATILSITTLVSRRTSARCSARSVVDGPRGRFPTLARRQRGTPGTRCAICMPPIALTVARREQHPAYVEVSGEAEAAASGRDAVSARELIATFELST